MGRKRTKKSVTKNNDRLMSLYIRNKHGKCEKCGNNDYEQLQWCHIKSRRFRSVRWDEDNCFCLCASDHRHFTDHPKEYGDWIGKHHARKYRKLLAKFQAVTKTSLQEYLDIEASLKRKLSDMGIDFRK